MVLRAEVTAREHEDHRVVPLQLAELAPRLGVVGQLVVGKRPAGCDVSAHRVLLFRFGCTGQRRFSIPFTLEASVAGGLTAVDVQDLAGDERGPLEIEDPVDDVADLAQPAERVQPARPS